tara:strand:- start:947 stop:1459 length:513 start_codon:yes stop_codon:yes gene_type:complete
VGNTYHKLGDATPVRLETSVTVHIQRRAKPQLANIKIKQASLHVNHAALGLGPRELPVNRVQLASIPQTAHRVKAVSLTTKNIKTKSVKQNAKLVTKQSRRVRSTTELLIPTATLTVSAILRALVAKTVNPENIRWTLMASTFAKIVPIWAASNTKTKSARRAAKIVREK